jgi:ubiquinone biosynthesis protein
MEGKPQNWLQRASYVARVFARYGFAPAMRRAGFGRFVPRTQAEPMAESDLPERFRMALQDLGPVAIKLGQMLATRPDLMRGEYVTELRKLQDAVETFPFEQAREVVETELGRTLEEVFAEFEEEPSAAASLAQVHRAKLLSGEDVAVKVQRPDAESMVETDVQIILAIARVMERYSKGMAESHVVEQAQDFAYYIRNELNFYMEAQNADRLREAVARFDYAKVAKVYRDYTTRRVLTMEWCDGARANDPEHIDALGIDRKVAAKNFATIFIYQMFGEGFFHGDPHPGNILLLPGEKVTFLDYGNAHSLGLDMRERLKVMVRGLIEEDAEALADEILDMGILSEYTDVQAVYQDVDRMLSHFASVQSSEVRVGEALDQVLSVVFKHRVRVPAVLGAMARAIVVAEGVGRGLDEHFDFRVAARETLPMIEPGGILGATVRRAKRQGGRLGRLAMILPKQLSRLLVRANAGGLKMRLEIDNVDQHLHRLDVMANRLSFSWIVAALMLSSAMIVSSEQGRNVITEQAQKVITLGGATCAGLAAIFGLWLLFSIIRSGRL